MPSIRNSAFSRRRFLVSAGSAGLGAAVALVGCGSGDHDDQAAPAQQEAEQQQARAQAAPPRTLRIAALGGSGGPLDPRAIDSITPWIALDHVYDYLARVTTNGFQNGLAESMTPNDDATVWTIRLRGDARFHEGGPVSAEDIAATDFDQALGAAQAALDDEELARQLFTAQEVAWRDGGDLIVLRDGGTVEQGDALRALSEPAAAYSRTLIEARPNAAAASSMPPATSPSPSSPVKHWP